MGLVGALLGGWERKEAPALSWLPEFLMNPETKSGITVNYKTALRVSAVLACCMVLGEGVAQVPWNLYQTSKDGKGAEIATDHPLHELISLKPNGWQTSFEFREMLVYQVALVRNAYVYKNRVGGRIHELIPLEVGRCVPKRLADMSIVYQVTGADGRSQTLGQDDIWHLRGATLNGWLGEETVRLAAEAIGLSVALENSHAQLHANGVQPGGVYSVADTLTELQQTQLTKWIKKQVGAKNRFDPLVLDRGAQWIAGQMTGVDSQHLETRRYQVEEVCRSLRVMPIMVGLSEKTATYASSEQMFLAHVIHTLMPWYQRIEQSAAVNLLTAAERKSGLYTKFRDQALMRGAYKDRQEGLQIQRRNGVINANEWRKLEEMNPRSDAGGEEYIVERNMGAQDGKPPSAPTA